MGGCKTKSRRSRWARSVVGAFCLCCLQPLACAAAEDDAFVLDDFEGGMLLWKGSAQLDSTLAKSGRSSLRWDAGPGGGFLTLETIPRDWSNCNRLSFWCHSFEATDARIMIRLPSENKNTDGIDYYHSYFLVDWTGWKKLTYDLRREFLPVREPVGWNAIDCLELRCEEWHKLQPVAGTVLQLDDFGLWQESPGDEQVVSDFERDVEFWKGLQRSKEQVKDGDSAGLWANARATPVVYNHQTIPRDWTGYTHLGLWLHSHVANGAEVLLRIVSENEATPEEDYYSQKIILDWQGWRELWWPLAKLSVARKPKGWDRIDSVAFHASGWDMIPRSDTRLHFDRLVLRKGQPPQAVAASSVPGATAVAAQNGEGEAPAEPAGGVPAEDGFQWRRDGLSLVLDDFESGVGRWNGLALDRELVRAGSAAGAWVDTTKVREVFAAVPSDWTAYDRLRLAVHSVAATGALINLLLHSDDPATPEKDYYSHTFAVDWTGWKELDLPLAAFAAARKPLGWNSIRKLQLSSTWAIRPVAGTSLRFDELRLCRDALKLTSLACAAKAGAEDRPRLEWKLRVASRLDSPTTVKLGASATGLPGGTAVVEPSQLALPPGEAGEVTVKIGVDDALTLPLPGTERPRVTCTATVETAGEQHRLEAALSDGGLFLAALRPGSHPRLFFTRNELPGLREKLKHPRVAEFWTAIMRWSGDLRQFRANVRGARTSEGRRRATGWGMRVNALAYLLTGEQERREAALAGLEALLACDTWLEEESVQLGRPMDIRSATLARLVAEVYDWLYDELSEETRAKVRSKLRQFCFEPAAEAWKRRDGYMTVYQYNWACLAYAGLGVAALAVAGEMPEAVEAGALALDGAGRILEAICQDGGWQEGVGYLEYGMPELTQFLDALRRASNGHTDWMQHSRWRALGEFELYTLLPFNRTMNFSDCHAFPHNPALLLKLAAELHRPDYQWAASPAQQMPNWWDVFQVIWYDTELPEKEPVGLPTAKHFRGIDWAVLRSGWSHPYAALGLRSGFRGPHAQLESNSVIVRLAGVAFVVDPGQPIPRDGSFYPKDYFTEKGWEHYERSTRSQNTILIDGKNQLPGEDGGRIAKLESREGYDYLCADATAVYEGALKVVRHVVFVKPDWYVIADEVATREPADIACLWHLETYLEQPVWEHGRLLAVQTERRPKGHYGPPDLRQRLLLVPLLPEGATPKVDKDERQLWRVTVGGPEQATERVFVTVLTAGQPVGAGDLGVTVTGAAQGSDYVVKRTHGDSVRSVTLKELLSRGGAPEKTRLTGIEVAA